MLGFPTGRGSNSAMSRSEVLVRGNADGVCATIHSTMLTTSLRTLATLVALGFSAAASPNFSGHWKLNTEKSKLDEPYQEERTIDHKDPELTVSLKATADGEAEESTAKYRTDGKETRNLIDGDPLFTTAHWDGDALVFDSQLVSDTETVEQHDRWTLSRDGKLLTVARKQKVGSDQRELVLVFDLL